MALHCDRFNSHGSNMSAYLTGPAALPHPDVDPAWYPDSGATYHIIDDLNNLSTRNDYNGNDCVLVGNGTCLRIFDTGSSTIHIARGGPRLVGALGKNYEINLF